VKTSGGIGSKPGAELADDALDPFHVAVLADTQKEEIGPPGVDRRQFMEICDGLDSQVYHSRFRT
jgi:hypothetical protein